MAYPNKAALADKYYGCQLVDVSTASIAYLPIVAQGVIVDAWAAISAGLTTANGTVTIKKGSTTLGTITLTQSGSAAGSTFQASFTASEANRSVVAGDVILFDSDGACDTTSIGVFTLVVREL